MATTTINNSRRSSLRSSVLLRPDESGTLLFESSEESRGLDQVDVVEKVLREAVLSSTNGSIAAFNVVPDVVFLSDDDKQIFV